MQLVGTQGSAEKGIIASGQWIGRINRSKTWPHPNEAAKRSNLNLLTERRPDRAEPSGKCGVASCHCENYRSCMGNETVTLWRPVGPDELRLIEASGMRQFPPRLPEQPIFYPVTTEDYAVKIARDWNVPASGSGFVTRFEVRTDFLSGYEVQEAGGTVHTANIGYPPKTWTHSTPRSSARSRSSKPFRSVLCGWLPLRMIAARSLVRSSACCLSVSR